MLVSSSGTRSQHSNENYTLISAGERKKTFCRAQVQRLPLVRCFPVSLRGADYMFSRAWHWFHVFPRLVLVSCFPALGTGFMFSRAWYWFHVFPRLVLVSYFPARGTRFMVSRAWY